MILVTLTARATANTTALTVYVHENAVRGFTVYCDSGDLCDGSTEYYTRDLADALVTASANITARLTGKF